MRVLRYRRNEETLYDFHTIKKVLGVNKSKLYRELKKIEDRDYVKYRNQFLFREKTLFLLMEKQLFVGLDKIQLDENEFSKD